MRRVNLSYDEVSDTMYITFGENRQAMGIELNEDFLLRIDPEARTPIGLTILNYKQVAKSDPLPLSGLEDLTSDLVEVTLRILKTPPVGHLVALSDDYPPQIKSRIRESCIEDVVGV